MGVVVTDLVWRFAVNRPDDDVSLVGGAIDTAARPLDAQNAADSDIEAVSDGVDVRTVTVQYYDVAGVLQSDPIVLNGTTPVALGTVVRQKGIYDLTLSAADGSRTVTVRRISAGAAIHVFNPTETFGGALFRGATSGASPKIYHVKCFLENTHATDTLTTVTSDETADASGLYSKGLAPSVDDVATAANRLTAPASVTFTDDAENVPGDQNLDAGEAIGVWFRASLPADQAPGQDTFDNEIIGTSV